MKKLLSMLLCAVMTVTCIGAVPAHAASSDTRLRVGLTISGASTFAAPQLENVSGYRTGYTVGTVSGTAFSGSKSITSSVGSRLTRSWCSVRLQRPAASSQRRTIRSAPVSALLLPT